MNLGGLRIRNLSPDFADAVPTSVELGRDPGNAAVTGHRHGWTHREPETLALTQTWICRLQPQEGA